MSIRIQFRIVSFVLAASTVAAVGCSSAAPVPDATQNAGADSIAYFDDPSGLLGSVSRKLADNVSHADIGKSFGTPDAEVPYPDTYWPMTDNGIDVQWNAPALSPLEKYMNLADAAHTPDAKTWTLANQGKNVPGVQSWFGICNGWSGSAVTELPVTKPVFAKMQGGKVQACTEGEAGCVRFEIGDVNALLAEVYSDADSSFIGSRCDTAPSAIKRDKYGRIDRDANGAGCKGLNPGALLIVLGQRMKAQKKAFVIDAQDTYNTDQIWNQPAYRYTVNDFHALTEKEAVKLVAETSAAPPASYMWNPQAKGFAYVDITLSWVTENGPNLTYVSGLDSTNTTRMLAVIELDKPASDASATIIGGEYLAGANGEANRLHTPPFVWFAKGPGPDVGGTHNPYVKSSIVKQLAALGQK